MEPDPIATLLRVSRVLEDLAIPYCVGGSLASSFYGIPRATNDVDLVVDLRPEHTDLLVAAPEGAFMIDPQEVNAAVAGGRSFTIIEDATLDKLDMFVVSNQAWPRQQIRRRQPAALSHGPGVTPIYFASHEDVILSKLVGYRRGREVSDRQWQDLLGVPYDAIVVLLGPHRPVW